MEVQSAERATSGAVGTKGLSSTDLADFVSFLYFYFSRDFLLCDYNRDGDSYRSPWSNVYFPKLDAAEPGFYPSEFLRKLELNMNEAFDQYRELYYEGGISSVYLWDTSHAKNFAGVILFKKERDSNS